MKFDFILVHPGTQHAYQLANAASYSGQFKRVYLFTGFLIRDTHFLCRFPLFRKRAKSITPGVRVYNFLLIEACLRLHKKINAAFCIGNNDPDYLWQMVFNWLMIPVIWYQRKYCLLALFETAGWPLVKYARQFRIPVIMDFPSMSHEEAAIHGIDESAFGKMVKLKERQLISYAFFCSSLAKASYQDLTSAKKSFVIPPGTYRHNGPGMFIPEKRSELKIACIANNELRKGLDTLLLAYKELDTPKKLYLVGKINKRWIKRFCINHQVDQTNIYLTGPLQHNDVTAFLLNKQVDLHILPSRFDAFGMVVPETMSLGIPNIVSRNVGAGETLQHGNNILIMPENTPAALAKLVNYYRYASPESKTALRRRVRRQAEGMSWQAYYERVAQALTIILEEQSL
ncbi:glycosyltransferase family 4 protein [Hufsiella ginkgonis]|uniref:Glycosyltransferase n=1 Tax=Hufsiella ginkgonis TaxID=2695274 RepID=A0A7K1Y3H4_9SPHI|nr:glycosyltransferase [Hufsiella ginkgonis]MXV17843.1 glycosyltransferase [Hufsiella ginkgonis]